MKVREGALHWVICDGGVLLSAAGLSDTVTLTINGYNRGGAPLFTFTTLVPLAFLLVFLLFLMVMFASPIRIFLIDELNAKTPAKLP